MIPGQTITYSLLNGQIDSGIYYDEIEAFGQKQIALMDKSYGNLVDRFQSYCENYLPEQPPSRGTLLFEALMLGMFWNIYGGFAKGSSDKSILLLNHAAHRRQKGGISRKYADFLRAGFAYMLLESSGNQHQFLFLDNEGLRKLIRWMQATGEFHREAKRLSDWLSFFESESRTYTFINICILRGFAAAFKTESQQVLGKYTMNVDRFIKTVKHDNKLREDKISILRQRSEYHLNMLGAFIYNLELRNEFLKTKKKTVLLPACMKARQSSACRAMAGKSGQTCTGCTKDCQVNQLSQLGLQYNFSVEIVLHSSDVSASDQFSETDTGFVGVACAASVIAGGLELMNKRIPAQCVLLDHCGCRHWSRKPETTSLNINELMFRIGISTISEINEKRTLDKKTPESAVFAA